MKKTFRAIGLMMLAIASISAVSCQQEPFSDCGNAETMRFEAVMGDEATKTVIQNETAVFWCAKDSIKVFYGTRTSGKFISENTSPAATATFTGTFDKFEASINIGATSSDFWGVYPYDAGSVCDGNSVTVTVPSVQAAVAGTFAPDLFPAIARSSGLSLAFYNVCGGVCFTVTEAGILSVTFKGNHGENVAGTAKVAVDSEGKPVVSSITSAASEITVNAPDDKGFVPGTAYYIVAYPASLEQGYSITYSKNATEATYTSAAAVELKRSVFGKVSGKDAGLTYGPKSGIIVFADQIAKYACVEKFDTNNDGEVSYAEAFAVTSLNNLFEDYAGVTSFEELKYFVNVIDLKGCFYGCPKLKTVTIPENITVIGDNAFRSCTALESIVIPSSVTTIGMKAFYGCTNLSEITIPASVTEIGSLAFDSNMKEVTMESATPPSIDEDSFVVGTKFYVPISALTRYKNKRNWIDHAENIVAFYLDLSEAGAANCYIVSAEGEYKIKTVKGNSRESVGTVASAEVLWESFGTDTAPSVGDLVSNASYADGYITFSASDKKGNAVIAAKDADGTILWSWHIWLTDKPEDQGYNNNAGTMMDRNLGATSATPGDVKALGLMYQWGRKDPFLGLCRISSAYYNDQTRASSTLDWPTEVSSNSTYGTIPYTVSHPTTFLRYNAANDDWYFTGSISTDDTRWQTTKTIYDPCPTGYRVPDGGSSGVWSKAFGTSSSLTTTSNWDNANKGMDFARTDKILSSTASTVWYPAAGYLSYISGFLNDVGGYGCYWSCSPVGNSASGLSFRDTRVYPSGGNFRASGLSVRCVQDYSVQPEIPVKDLSTDGTANCYVVSEDGNYKFNASVKGGSTESVGTIASAEVLWESFGTDVAPNVGDLVSNVSYADGYITFSASDKKGNSVIAAKDADGTILWSWHIWLTDKPEDQVYDNNAGTMMDRNLGATSATPGDVQALGLIYQWGRKDPFLGGCQISYSSSNQTKAASTLTWPSVVSSNSSNGTISYTVSHPTTFITYNNNNGDWYYTRSSSTDNARWQTSDKDKGVYDPCPAGYRVPDGGSTGVWSKAFGTSSYWTTTSNWDDSNKGMDFVSTDRKLSSTASSVWYPAAGFLHTEDGSLYNVGLTGDYWSCSPNGNCAYTLDFNSSGHVNPSYSFHRAYGITVRCLQE